MKYTKILFALVIAWMIGAHAQAAVGDVFTTNVNGVNMTFKVTSENGSFWAVSVYGNATTPAIDINTVGPVVIPDKFTYNNKTCTVYYISNSCFRNCTGVTSFTLPSTLLDIGEYAFAGCTALTEITIHIVNSIRRRAFSGCTSLEKLVLDDPEGYVTNENNMEIEEGAFFECPLKEVVNSSPIPCRLSHPEEVDTRPVFNSPSCVLRVPDGCVEVYQNTYWGLYFDGRIYEMSENIEEVENQEIFSSVTAEGLEMWFMVTDNEEYTVMTYSDGYGYPCVEIPDGQTSVTIPEKVTYKGHEFTVTMIGESSFTGCTTLESVTIPSTVMMIGADAFSACENLTSITIPGSVTEIGEYAFESSGLTSVTIPGSVTTIGEAAFTECLDLTSAIIEEGVETIGEGAFAYSGLTSVTIPSSVTEIGIYAFGECLSLASIKVDDDNEYYDSRDKCNAIILTSWDALLQGCKNTIIPDGVKIIADDAFFACVDLTSITIPSSVTRIGAYSFAETGLTFITIPSSVTEIGDFAFEGCPSLASIKVDVDNECFDSRDNSNAIIETSGNVLVQGCKNTTIPNSVTEIGYGAFTYCTSLTSITIPSSIVSIGHSAFIGCENLSLVVSLATTPPSLGNVAFETASDAVLHVPATAVSDYENSDWSEYFPIISSLTDITIGESGLATFSSASALDFTSVNGLKAYIVSVFDPTSSEITLTHLDKAPAGTGLLLKGNQGTYQVPAINYVAGVANMLVPIMEDITLYPTENEGFYTNFVLTRYEGRVGFFRFDTPQSYPAGKAYLRMETSLVEAAGNDGQGSGVAGFKLVFDDEEEATGIVELSAAKSGDGTIYNLSGQRVNQADKGVYIMEGKKVLVK